MQMSPSEAAPGPSTGPPSEARDIEAAQAPLRHLYAFASLGPWHLVIAIGVPYWVLASSVRITALSQLMSAAPAAELAVTLATHLVFNAAMLPLVLLGYRAGFAIGWPRHARWRALLAHLATAAVVCGLGQPILMAAALAMDGGLARIAELPQQVRDLPTAIWTATALNLLMAYGFGLALLGAARALLALQRAQVDRANLRADWLQARLAALRMQMNPHFLFNALNTVAATVEREPARARKLVLAISDLFRRSLATGDSHWTSLREDLQFVRDYLEVQAARFSGRFRFEIVCPPAVEDEQVPAMLLLPLVENAVMHGQDDDRDSLHVEVRVQRRQAGERAALEIVVRNRTSGRLAPGRQGLGLGLRNLRERLVASYDNGAQFTHAADDASGYTATVTVPAAQVGGAGTP